MPATVASCTNEVLVEEGEATPFGVASPHCQHEEFFCSNRECGGDVLIASLETIMSLTAGTQLDTEFANLLGIHLPPAKAGHAVNLFPPIWSHSNLQFQTLHTPTAFAIPLLI
jgi:hypothetical protein